MSATSQAPLLGRDVSGATDDAKQGHTTSQLQFSKYSPVSCQVATFSSPYGLFHIRSNVTLKALQRNARWRQGTTVGNGADVLRDRGHTATRGRHVIEDEWIGRCCSVGDALIIGSRLEVKAC